MENDHFARLEQAIDEAVTACVFGSREQAVHYLVEKLKRLERDFIWQQIQDTDA